MAKIVGKLTIKINGEYCEVLSKKQYSERFHGLTIQALDYAVKKDLVDYYRVGHSDLIVMTEKTKLYTPNKSKRGGLGSDIIVK